MSIYTIKMIRLLVVRSQGTESGPTYIVPTKGIVQCTNASTFMYGPLDVFFSVAIMILSSCVVFWTIY